MSRAELLVSIVAASAVIAPAWADVTLTAQQRANFGVQLEALERQSIPRSWQATGEVLDPSGLIAAMAELRSARQAFTAAQAELLRNRKLFENDTAVSRRVVEAARTQAMADEARVTTAEAQLRSAWGTGPGSPDSAAGARLLADLRAGKVSLVRLDFIVGPAARNLPPEVALRSLDEGSRWTGRTLGPFPRTGSAALGGSILVRVPGALVPGQVVSGSVLDARGAQRGYLVPASAVFQWQGAEWFYFEDAANHFVRQPLHDEPAGSGGARVVAMETDGPLHVVSVGARSLLGVEVK